MTDIKKLKEIIDEIDVLINKSVQRSEPEFEAWHDKATRFIYNHYGENSPEYNGFSKISYFPCALTMDSNAEDYIKDCKQGLETAKGILNNYLSELSEDEPTRTPYEQSNSAINRRFCYTKELFFT